jgi:hypothetical protein
VPRTIELLKIPIPDSIDGAFDAAPNLQWMELLFGLQSADLLGPVIG